jgi:hypothetical protein
MSTPVVVFDENGCLSHDVRSASDNLLPQEASGDSRVGIVIGRLACRSPPRLRRHLAGTVPFGMLDEYARYVIFVGIAVLKPTSGLTPDSWVLLPHLCQLRS